MKANQIAAQLFTLRNFLKTPEDIAQTLSRVKAMGYDAVQCSGLGPIEPADLKKLLDDNGLVCCATHEKGAMIVDEPNAVVDKLGALGCKHTAYPHPHLPLTNFSEVMALCERLDKAGAVLAQAGQVLSYHNHAKEFIHIEGKPIFRWLFELTRPACLQGEPDVHWVARGGGSPEYWCRYLNERLPLIHLKDFGLDAEGAPRFAEIGYGNLDMPAIIAAAEASGCEWFIIEQDNHWIDDDPFKALQMSFDWLVANVCD